MLSPRLQYPFPVFTLIVRQQPCQNLKSLKLGPDVASFDEPLSAGTLLPYLDTLSSLETLQLRGAGFDDTDSLFTHLQRRHGLRSLEIDLEPGISLLPQLEGLGDALVFPSLTHLDVMCYPETAIALLPHLPLLESLQLDICRIPERPSETVDYNIMDELVYAMSVCSRLRVLKIGIGPLAFDFPSADTLPKLSGGALVRLVKQSPNLEDICLFASEPSALDASRISSDEFEQFCQSSQHLRSLVLKLDPTTATSLPDTALGSLGKYCQGLEVLRLRMPCVLSNLSRSPSLPGVPLHRPIDQRPGHSNTSDASVALRDANFANDSKTQRPSQVTTFPLFPHLTHLAVARPHTVLYESDEGHINSYQPSSPDIGPEKEEEIVRSWAVALLAHFPKLEILEAWSDFMGRNNESLNYFLPTEEILASTWEFLSGVEQNLWEDDFDEDESWHTSGTRDDWDAASYLNEYPAEDDPAFDAVYVEEEPEDMVTPGRTLHTDEYFEHPPIHEHSVKTAVLPATLANEDAPAIVTMEKFGAMKIA